MTRTRRQQGCLPRLGFTLVEMLVVVAIIGILVAMLLPVIQSAREAARRSNCSANLKQLGLAMHLHVDSSGRLPASAVFANSDYGMVTDDIKPGTTEAPFSWQARLLPYVEQGEAFDTFNFKQSPFDDANSNNLDVTRRVIPVLLCPSYGGASRSGADDYVADADGRRSALSNYVGLGATTMQRLRGPPGAHRRDFPPDGALFHGLRLQFRQYRDGITKTLMLTETVEENYSAWADGTTATTCGIHPNVGDGLAPVEGGGGAMAINCEGDDGEPFFKATSDFGGKGDMQWGVSSNHPGMALHTMVDGSVHSLSDETTPFVYHGLITRANGDGPLILPFFDD